MLQETHQTIEESKKLVQGWVNLAISNVYSTKSHGIHISVHKGLYTHLIDIVGDLILQILKL